MRKFVSRHHERAFTHPNSGGTRRRLKPVEVGSMKRVVARRREEYEASLCPTCGGRLSSGIVCAECLDG